MSKPSGTIIAIDGPDGSGKTTQIKLLATYLLQKGHDVHTTRASGGTPIGGALRKISLSDTPRSPEVDVYISLAMNTAVGQDAQKRKQAGQVVLIDRSPLAVIAYNIFGSQLSDPQQGYDACQTLLRLWQLDYLFVFEADQTVLDQRRATRTDKPADYFEKQPADYYRRVQQGYRRGAAFTQELPKLGTHIITIDANQNVQQTQTDLRNHLAELL